MITFSADTLITDANAALSTAHLPAPVQHRLFGNCELTALEAKYTPSGFDIFLTLSLPSGEIKKFSYLAIPSNTVALPVGIADLLADTVDASADAVAELHEREAKQREERIAELKAAEEAAKKARAEESYRANLAAKICKMRPENLETVLPKSEFYKVLGWMARHVKLIKPVVPEELLDWFTKNFGTVDCVNVISEDSLTANGHKMKWTVSFKISFTAQVPEVLANKYGAKRYIDSVGLVWDLVANRGFAFGDEQDILRIRSLVPDAYKDAFDEGLQD